MKKTLNEQINNIELRKKGIVEDSDGLRHCLRCGAPLQRKKIDSNGVVNIIDVPCRCQELKMQRNKEKIRQKCFVSPILSTYRYNTLQNKDEKENQYLAKFIRKFVKIKEKGIGVYIYSLSDQSRTFNLARVANGLIDRGFSVKYITARLFSNIRNIPNADYSALLKKLASFDAIAFADLDLMCPDETKLSFLYGVLVMLISNGVTLLISSDKHINGINPDSYYGQKIKELIKKRCLVIRLLDEDENNKINIQKVARNVLWMFEDEGIIHEE